APGSSAMRAVTLILPTALSAVLYGLAFPVASLQPLAWIALVPFLVTVRRAGLGATLVLAWIWMTVMAYTVGDWFASGIARYFAQPLVVGIGFFFGVSTVMAGIEHMAFAACYRTLRRAPRVVIPVLAGAAWVTAEFARVRLLTGNPWALLGY